MNYLASITDFFKSPKWMMNLLLGGVCMLIPIVGPLVLLGWLITGFWGRKEEAYETFPEFDFGQFSKYLERGLWPFLVMLVSCAVLVPLMWIVMLIPMLILGALSGGGDSAAAGIMGAIVGLIMMLLYFVMMAAVMIVLKPLVIRATLLQDFSRSFDFAFVKKFATLTWKETVLSTLFLAVAGMVLVSLGALVFCVGMYFALALVYFAWGHLDKQVYQLFVARGGEAIPVSPKLNDAPPVLPI